MTSQLQPHDWTFLSNHSHVLHCISFWPDIRIRDIAVKVQITERAVQRIVVDLEQGGYLKRKRVGRQNHYRLQRRLHLRHPLEHHVKVGQLLSVLQQPETAAREMSIQNPRDSAVVIARGINAVPSRADAKVTSRSRKRPGKLLKKRPRKPRKLIAKESV